MLSTGKATLHELSTVYGVEACYDMLEVVSVDAHNRELTREFNERNNH